MSLTFAAETLEALQYGVRMASETENHMTSVERVFTYTEIDPEPGYNTETQPPEAWPTAAGLTLQDLSLAYLNGAPATLNSISFCIAAKEKVGVAGRTGAGKSSLVAALFRMPEPEGSVRTVIPYCLTVPLYSINLLLVSIDDGDECGSFLYMSTWIFENQVPLISTWECVSRCYLSFKNYVLRLQYKRKMLLLVFFLLLSLFFSVVRLLCSGFSGSQEALFKFVVVKML